MIQSVAQNGLTVQESGFLGDLERDGFRLIRCLTPRLSTIEVAQTLGIVIDVERLLPRSGISTVQPLLPRNISETGRNQYSGCFGLGTFPLHSDLAHWAVPPHYFLLRCLVGFSDVFTYILDWRPIANLVGAGVLRKALFSARRRRIGYSGLVCAMSHQDGTVVLRWDPIFLTPLNQHAEVLASAMRDPIWIAQATKISLNHPGDTLIVDNWRILHGRGDVSAGSTGRRIDRVYLSEVFQ